MKRLDYSGNITERAKMKKPTSCLFLVVETCLIF